MLLVLLAGCGGDAGGGFDRSRDVEPGWEGDVEDWDGRVEPIYEAPFIPLNARDDQVKALERANWYREMCSLPPLDMLDSINKAAQAHSDFYAKHAAKYASTGLSPHNENSAWEGYVGATPWERMGKFGYAQGASEVMAFVHNPVGAVDGWMNTLYHRIPFMDASLVACGYGAAGGGAFGSTAVDTLDFGTSDAAGKSYSGPMLVGIYPPPGSSGIPPSFDGMESPQPPPPPTGYPSGTIVSVTWSKDVTFLVEKHEIWVERTQQQLAHVWVDHSNDPNLSGSSTVALYPHKPLEKGTKHWVHIKGKVMGQVWDETWYFHTERY